MRRSTVTVAVATLSLLSGCLVVVPNPMVTLGNGNRVEQVRTVADFTAVENYTSLPIDVAEGDFRVALVLDENLVELVDTTVVDGTLIVDANGNFTTHLPGAGLRVWMPRLLAVTNNSSGSVTAGPFTRREPRVDLVVTSSGNLEWCGDADEVVARTESSGSIELCASGAAVDRLAATVTSAGSLRATGLTATNAELINRSSGSLFARLGGGELRLRLESAGSIQWYGTATVVEQLDTGAGSIVHVP